MNNLHLNPEEPTTGNLISNRVKTYQAQQLPALLAALQNKQVSGVLQLEAWVNDRHRQTLLIVDRGQFVYGGSVQPTTAEIVALLKQQGGEWINLAISSTLEQSGYQLTPHALLSRLVAMHLLTWEKIADLFLEQVAIALEPFLKHPGQFALLPQSQPETFSRFNLEQVLAAVQRRQMIWSTLRVLPNGMDTIPFFSAKTLQFLASGQSQHADVINLPLQQLLGWVDEQQAIFEIGITLRRDPLLVARELLPAFQQGWLVAEREQADTIEQRPTILVVDDSDLMRQLIQRVLRDRYRVIVAGTAMEALGLLDQEPVELMLLDVSMPGIDGLELCRSVRNMSRFRDLPIVMVTARDGFFDKVKGRMAGATEYLTKPFENEQLMDLVGQYVQPFPSEMV